LRGSGVLPRRDVVRRLRTPPALRRLRRAQALRLRIVALGRTLRVRARVPAMSCDATERSRFRERARAVRARRFGRWIPMSLLRDELAKSPLGRRRTFARRLERRPSARSRAGRAFPGTEHRPLTSPVAPRGTPDRFHSDRSLPDIVDSSVAARAYDEPIHRWRQVGRPHAGLEPTASTPGRLPPYRTVQDQSPAS
jgi:hypothetical protein